MRDRPRDHLASAPVGRHQLARDLLVVAALAGAVGVVLGAIALRQPARRVVSRAVPYRVVGVVGYHAPVDPRSIYGRDQLSTGEPVYLGLVHMLTITVAYRVVGTQPMAVTSRARLAVVVSAGQGLSRIVPMAVRTHSDGARGTISGLLAVSALESIVQGYQAASVDPPLTISVQIRPSITVRGVMLGRSLATTAGSPIPFMFTGQELEPPSVAAGQQNPFRLASAGSVSRPVTVPAQLTLLFLTLGVDRARWIALGLLVAAALIALVAGLPLLRALTHREEAVRIEARHGSEVVPVLDVPPGPVVEMASFEGLAEVARRYDGVILRAPAGSTVAYLVLDTGIVYRYVVPISGASAPDMTPPPPWSDPPRLRAALTAPAAGGERSGTH